MNMNSTFKYKTKRFITFHAKKLSKLIILDTSYFCPLKERHNYLTPLKHRAENVSIKNGDQGGNNSFSYLETVL